MCAGVRSIGISEGHVHARYLFILQDVSDDILKSEFGADGKFADPIAIFIAMSVAPELFFELLVIRAELRPAGSSIFTVSGVSLDRRTCEHK